jgi:hypothetical protein
MSEIRVLHAAAKEIAANAVEKAAEGTAKSICADAVR